MKKRISVSVETKTLESLSKKHGKDLYRILRDYIVSLHEIPKDDIFLNSTIQTRKNTLPIRLAEHLQGCFMVISSVASKLDEETQKMPIKLVEYNKEELHPQFRNLKLAIIEAERIMYELDMWVTKDKLKIKKWIDKERKKITGEPPDSESQF